MGVNSNVFNVFDELEVNSVKYFVWKDIYNISSFKNGNAELDIYVLYQDRKAFEKVLIDNGYIRFNTRKALSINGIVHYLKFENGRYFHLHAYYKLYTGNHYVKQYWFHIKDELFNTAVLKQNIRVANPNLECALILLRFLSKGLLLGESFKLKERERLIELLSECDDLIVSRILEEIIPGAGFSVGDIMREIERAPLLKVFSFRIMNALRAFRRMSFIAMLRFYVRARVSLQILRVNRSSNKMLRRGISIALVGTDGSVKPQSPKI